MHFWRGLEGGMRGMTCGLCISLGALMAGSSVHGATGADRPAKSVRLLYVGRSDPSLYFTLENDTGAAIQFVGTAVTDAVAEPRVTTLSCTNGFGWQIDATPASDYIVPHPSSTLSVLPHTSIMLKLDLEPFKGPSGDCTLSIYVINLKLDVESQVFQL